MHSSTVVFILALTSPASAFPTVSKYFWLVSTYVKGKFELKKLLIVYHSNFPIKTSGRR